MKERKNIIFSQEEDFIHHLWDKIKLLSHWWLHAKYVKYF